MPQVAAWLYWWWCGACKTALNAYLPRPDSCYPIMLSNSAPHLLGGGRCFPAAQFAGVQGFCGLQQAICRWAQGIGHQCGVLKRQSNWWAALLVCVTHAGLVRSQCGGVA
jgi:hypothetical protein